METSKYFSREDDGALEMMEEFTRKGIFFVEHKYTQTWVADGEHSVREQSLTNDPHKAKRFESKMIAMTFMNQHNMKLGVWTVTEHEFI